MFSGRTPRRGGLRYPGAHAGPFLDEFCQTHGWSAHVVLHEASHAVAAIDRGMGVVQITVIAPEHWAAPDRRGMTSGGVELAPLKPNGAESLVERRAGLEVAVVGSLAEVHSLGHYLPGSFDGDMGFWKARDVLSSSPKRDWVDEIIGESFAVLVRRVEAWVADNIERIDRVGHALGEMIDRESRGEAPLSKEWSIDEHAVMHLLG